LLITQVSEGFLNSIWINIKCSLREVHSWNNSRKPKSSRKTLMNSQKQRRLFAAWLKSTQQLKNPIILNGVKTKMEVPKEIAECKAIERLMFSDYNSYYNNFIIIA